MSDLPGIGPEIEAHVAGYSWDDIDSHVAQASQQAVDAGYSQQEIDSYLGYKSPDALRQRLVGQFATAQNADPKMLADLKEPQPQVNLNLPTVRSDYGNALLNQEVRGPGDFADHYAAAALDAAHTIHGMDASGNGLDARLASGALASDVLASNLPSSRDLTDATLHLIGDQPHQFLPVRQNLVDHWVDTGEHPVTAALRAGSDPTLMGKLASAASTVFNAPQTAFDWLANRFGAERENFQTALATERAQMEPRPGETQLDAIRRWNTTIAHMTPDEFLALPSVQLAFGISTGELPSNAATVAKAIDKAPIAHVDLTAPPDQAVTMKPIAPPTKPAEMTPERVADMEQATEKLRQSPEAQAAALQFPVETTPVEKVQGLAKMALDAQGGKLEAMRLQRLGITQDEFDRPNFFQHLAAGEDAQTRALAQGHDTAVTIGSWFMRLMRDTSGELKGGEERPLTEDEQRLLAGLNPRPQTPEEPPAIIGRAVGAGTTEHEFAAPPGRTPNETRNLMRDLIIKHQSRGEQLVNSFMAAVNQTRQFINPHLPEWEREIEALKRGDPGADPMSTAIGAGIQHAEGVGPVQIMSPDGGRVGALLEPNSPVTPVFDQYREINDRIHQVLQDRVASGAIDPIGYVQDYWRHAWTNPGEAERLALGRQGSNASFKERTIPTIADGIRMGLVPKIIDPADLMNFDVGGKLRYLAQNDLWQEMKREGIIRTGTYPMTGEAQLEGRFGGITERSYAPKSAARLYNNAISTGWYGGPLSDAYRQAMYIRNTLVGTKLMLPIFHSAIVAEQRTVSLMQELARRGLAGEWDRSLDTLQAAKLGREKVIPAYLNLADDPALKYLVDAGARFTEGRQDPYALTGARTWQQAAQWNKGHIAEAAMRELSRELHATGGTAEESAAKRVLMAGPRLGGMALHEYSRALASTSAPLFEQLIPHSQAGVMYSEMSDYLRRFPDASDAAIAKRARQIVGNVQDRYGELNQDNLLWNRWLKHAANFASISTSWAYGTWRWLLASAGMNLERRTFEWNPSATGSLVSNAMLYAAINGLATFGFTGQMPSGWDWLNFRTKAHNRFGDQMLGMMPTEFKELYDIGGILATSYGRSDPFYIAPGLAGYLGGKGNSEFQMLHDLLDRDAEAKIAASPGGVAGYIAKTMLSPIVLDQYNDEAAAAAFGPARLAIRQAPWWVENPSTFLGYENRKMNEFNREAIRHARQENALSGVGVNIPGLR